MALRPLETDSESNMPASVSGGKTFRVMKVKFGTALSWGAPTARTRPSLTDLR